MMHAAQYGDGREAANMPSRRKWLTISSVVLAMGLAGCAREPEHREFNLSQREVKTKREVRVTHIRSPLHGRRNADARRHAELHVQRPDPALLAPQPAPNCEFKRSDVKTVDANEWARLKTEYERQCYQDAEKTTRERLGQLQASIARAPEQRSAR
jgi:hypothetical protein